MSAPYIYYMPAGGPEHGRDMQAAIRLLREAYKVENASLAPADTPGFIYQTATSVSDDDRDVLGIVPWV